MTPHTERLYSFAYVARIIGVTPQAVQARVKAGRLKFVELHGKRFVSFAQVKLWKDERNSRGKALLESHQRTK